MDSAPLSSLSYHIALFSLIDQSLFLKDALHPLTKLSMQREPLRGPAPGSVSRSPLFCEALFQRPALGAAICFRDFLTLEGGELSL